MKNIPSSRIRKIRTWTIGSKNFELRPNGLSKEISGHIDLASNDYLGLSRHPSVIEAAQKSIVNEGMGAGASRLVTGSRPIHEELETELASWLGVESVLLFPSGFQANIAAVIALADRQTPVITDKFIHHSLLIGIKASGAKLYRFKHNNLLDLESKLKTINGSFLGVRPVVITESLFSMEGTSPELNKLTNLCKKYNSRLLVDEAHALGVMGKEGKGLCYQLQEEVDLISGTFGKAFGSGGAFLASSKKLRETLIQTSGAFRYTTALAPPLAAAALASLHLIKENPKWGEEVVKNASLWRNKIEESGWEKPPGGGQILSLLIGKDEAALNYQRRFEREGLLSIAIRPPTVPENTSRLRIVLRKDLPNSTLNKVLNTLKNK